MTCVAAALAACATSGEAKQGELVTAQQKAQVTSQTAADAQKVAASEQLKAEQDKRDLTVAQQNQTAAETALREQRSKAEAAQVEARTTAEAAHQQGIRAQTESTLNQQTLAQQERAATEQQAAKMEQTVQGRVVSLQGNDLLIWTPQSQNMNLDLSSSMVRVDGQQSSAAQIKPGSDVRASYKMVDGKAKVLQIDVTSQQ
ncbi:MAG: hypothetical protein ACXWLM_12615 [Myxococcales bacterium]